MALFIMIIRKIPIFFKKSTFIIENSKNISQEYTRLKIILQFDKTLRLILSPELDQNTCDKQSNSSSISREKCENHFF